MTSMLLTKQQAACIKYADNKKNRFISMIVTGYLAWFSKIKKTKCDCVSNKEIHKISS